MNGRRFEPYLDYKSSGVEWLGEIPAHWEVRRLKFVAPIRVAKLHLKPDDAVYVGLEHVESWTGRLLLESQPESVDSVVGSFRSGDVLFGKLRPYLAKAARPDFDGICTSEILSLRPMAGGLPSFLMYCMLNAPYIRWLDSLTYGTKMPRVSPEQVGNSFVVVPPVPEQRTIAAFLDRETARIDALVAKKGRLIELLQEKRTAVITRAVTKGLDPTVPLKDSGIEWLGEIPAHWEVRRTDAFLRYDKIQIEPSEISNELVFHYSIPLVQETGNGALELSSDIESAKLWIVGQRVLICKLNPRKGLVVIALKQDVPTLCSTEFVPLEVRGSDIGWVMYLFLAESTRQRLSAVVRSATRSHQRAEVSEITKFWQGVPPLLEQRATAAFLDRETAKLDALIAKVREAIDLLRELRVALISAAVTGKIDVREESA